MYVHGQERRPALWIYLIARGGALVCGAALGRARHRRRRARRAAIPIVETPGAPDSARIAAPSARACASRRSVAFLIVPLFGFANAGVALAGLGFGDLFAPLPLGIAAGLFFGKQVGIFGAVWLCGEIRHRRAGCAGATWLQIYGVSLLCGIGFTMSLFIGALAFPGNADADRGGEARHAARLARSRRSPAMLVLRFAPPASRHGRSEAQQDREIDADGDVARSGGTARHEMAAGIVALLLLAGCVSAGPSQRQPRRDRRATMCSCRSRSASASPAMSTLITARPNGRPRPRRRRARSPDLAAASRMRSPAGSTRSTDAPRADRAAPPRLPARPAQGGPHPAADAAGREALLRRRGGRAVRRAARAEAAHGLRPDARPDRAAGARQRPALRERVERFQNRFNIPKRAAGAGVATPPSPSAGGARSRISRCPRTSASRWSSSPARAGPATIGTRAIRTASSRSTPICRSGSAAPSISAATKAIPATTS